MALSPLRDNDPARIGRFRLSARLGAGAMGVVYLGTAKDGTQAAIKLLRPELADDDEFRVRFRREVSTLARVNGVCTIRVIEADTESDRPYLATEYAEGPSLAERVSAAGPLDGGLLPGLAVGLAEGLAAIHSAGIVHRDLKPGNVLLTAGGPRVIDFGIAQTLDATAVTRTGMAIGSPGYMAPEQLTGDAGQPADVFSWGVTVAFAATGASPFGSGPAEAVMYRIRHEPPDTSGVGEPLRGLVERALSKSPGDRPTAPALLAELAGEAGQGNVPADSFTEAVLTQTWVPRAGVISGPGSTVRSGSAVDAGLGSAYSGPGSTVYVGGIRPARRRRSRLGAILAIAAVIVVVAGVAVWALMARGTPSTTAGLTSDPTSAPRSPASTSPAPARTRSAPATSSAPSSTAPAVSPSSSGASAPAAPPGEAQAGTVDSGSLSCGFQAQDGGNTVDVAALHVADCQQVSETLASYGAYWNRVSASSATLPNYEQVCDMSNPAGAVMSVYEVTNDGNTTSSAPLGSRVCQGQERDGWTPHTSTQG